MNSKRLAVLSIAAAFVLTSTLGCFFSAPPDRTNNQGGGNVITATTKVIAGQMTQLTPDEVQAVSDTISDLNPNVDLVLSDDQAQVVVSFLNQNNVNSIEDLQGLDPNTIQIPDNVEVLFNNLNLVVDGMQVDPGQG